jgi:hypothetical protein
MSPSSGLATIPPGPGKVQLSAQAGQDLGGDQPEGGAGGRELLLLGGAFPRLGEDPQLPGAAS